jgi:hypothetical protein
MGRNAIIISEQNLETIKYRMKRVLATKYLPVSPEDEEGWPIFSDYTSWVYRYYDFVEDDVHEKNRISFKIKVVLKKQFHEFVDVHRFCFNVVCVYSEGKYEVNVFELVS